MYLRMGFLLLFILLKPHLFAKSETNFSSSVGIVQKCHKIHPGPPGGGESIAFGSYYTTDHQTIAVDELVNFSLAHSHLHISHPNNSDFIIQKKGYYLIEYGVANGGDTTTTLAIVINNNTELTGSRLKLPPNNALTTIALIVPLLKGDTLNVINLEEAFELDINGALSPNPIKAYINFIHL